MVRLFLVLLAVVDLLQTHPLIPRRYHLRIQLPSAYSSNRSLVFFASLEFEFTAVDPFRWLQLHGRGLHDMENITLSSKRESFDLVALNMTEKDGFSFDWGTQLAPGQYVLAIARYWGNVTGDDQDGLFGRLNSNGELLLATHLQPSFARTLLPCVDEPWAKATLQLEVIHVLGTRAISNAVSTGVQLLDTEWQLTNFADTPPLSPYLFAFAVLPGSFAEVVSVIADYRIPEALLDVNGSRNTNTICIRECILSRSSRFLGGKMPGASLR
jgi:hypothetical protein